MNYFAVGRGFIMSYKHRLQYTSFGQRRRELRSLAQKYLEKEASRCEEFALYTKKELRRYIARFLKKLHKQLSGLRGVLLLSLLILYHCTGSSNPGPNDPKSGDPMDDPIPEPDPMLELELKRIFVANQGPQDLILGVPVGGVNRAYRSDGTANFTEGSNISSDAHVSNLIALGDLDGDGDLDMVVANEGVPGSAFMLPPGEVNRVYINDGAGNFTGGSNIFSDAHVSRSIALDDLNGDGNLDIVVANYRAVNKVYLGDGTGDFTGVSGSDISADANNSFSIAVGDFDGDGDLDIVVGNNRQTNRVYLGDGTGDFTGGSNISTDANDSQSITLGDLDGDGHLDIVVGNASNQINKVYLGDGTGDFTGVSGSNISTDANNSLSIALDDLDGDGHLDIVVANNGVNRVYLGDGSGDFTGVSGSNISTDRNHSFSIALGDLDGDGDLDIVVANYMAVNRVYRNDTAGVFIGSNISADVNSSSSIVIE